MSNELHGTVTLFALRYMMGRMTYGVGLIADYIKAHWQTFTDEDRSNMRRDLAEELRRSGKRGEELGMEMDTKVWRALLTWMEHNLET